MSNVLWALHNVLYNTNMTEKLSAASAAAKLAREMVKAGTMSRDDAILFSNWIDREVKLGHLPDDANMLGLVQSGEWKTASSNSEPRSTGRVISIGPWGISLNIFKPPASYRKRRS